MRRIAIVGAGIAGLSFARALQRNGAAYRGVDVRVFEASKRPGGNIRTERFGGFLCECGPNGFLDNVPATLDLARDVGLGSSLLPASERASRRYIFHRGRLRELPAGPIGFLTSGLVSWRAKARIAREPWAAPRPDGDETIHAFATRRIGREAADVLIDAMVSGVFGGDARELSLRACFPRMWDLETEYGGLFRAMRARRSARKASGAAMGSPLGRLTSFTRGSEALVQALAGHLGQELRLESPVVRIEFDRRFRVTVAGGDAVDADAVVLAGGAASSASIVASFDSELSAVFREIPTAPMVVVCLGYDHARLPRPFDGFGFLIPRGEGERVLGVLWDSSIFPGRAPDGSVLMRAMLGGAHDPDAIGLDDDALIAIARRALADTMGVRANPGFAKVIKHPIGIPQYTVGHLDRLVRIDARIATHPGLVLVGNSFRGVAINNCVAESANVAPRLLDQIARDR